MDDHNTEAALPPCLQCRTGRVARNWTTRAAGSNFLRRSGDRRLVEVPRKRPMGEVRKALGLRSRCERMPIRAVARLTSRSCSWLQLFVNAHYLEGTPREPEPLTKKG